MKAVRAVGLLMIAALAFARDCVSGPLSAAEVAPAWKPREAGKTVRNLAAARPSAEDGVRWKNALNLLPLIDTASRDVRAGRWKGEHGALVSDDHWGARIEIPYKPPDEYDCRIAFTKLQPTERTEGRIDGIDLYLPRCGRTVAWAVGGWQNSVSGLERVAGTNPGQPENPTEIKHSAFLKVGQKHIVIVEVRKDSIMGYLDGELITQWKGNWKDLNFPAWVSQTLLGFASYSPTVFHCIEVVEVTGKGTFFERGDRRLAITSPVLEETRWKNAVSLLPRIDPPKHARGGKWEIKGGELLSDETWGAHLKLPYQPPEEYDCRICFTKTKPEGKLDGLNVWLPRSGHTVAWCVGGWGNTICGLEYVKGVNPSDEKNPTGVRWPAFLKVGHKHTVVAEVRRDSVRGYLDAELITEWQGDWKDLDFPEWVSRTHLEMATYSPTVFHGIEVVEVTGRGAFARQAAPVIESTLEAISIMTKERKVIYRAQRHFAAPNWSPDGKYFVFNSEGRLFTLPVEGGQPTMLDTGFAGRCNNDHGFSPDGSLLAISHDGHDKGSLIYTLPARGGSPKLVTPKGPSYWHGWSPDGTTLAYCAERDAEYDIYTIPVQGGGGRRLTHAPGVDDGPDYTPDGKYIYFNSERTGTMKIWRMKVDGGEQEQVTFDEYNDWFPHPSPDRKCVVFLSYEKDVKGHPANKNVMLRMVCTEGGKPELLDKLFGGQGTLNVPSWSPDSRHVAFVSYRLIAP